MALKPIKFYEGKEENMAVAASQTIVKGDMLVDNGSGYLGTVSAGGGVTPTHVALQAASSTSAGDLVLCVRVNGVLFEADCDAAPAQTDVGTFADLASKSTIDPDASSDDVFYIESIKGTVGTSTVVTGWFQIGAPNA